MSRSRCRKLTMADLMGLGELSRAAIQPDRHTGPICRLEHFVNWGRLGGESQGRWELFRPCDGGFRSMSTTVALVGGIVLEGRC